MKLHKQTRWQFNRWNKSHIPYTVRQNTLPYEAKQKAPVYEHIRQHNEMLYSIPDKVFGILFTVD